MKKHDEGYVLVYVTVVLLVFCLVATTILTGALNNLQHQQAANEQMKSQYVAEGMIEKVVAQLDAKGDITIKGYTELADDNQTIVKRLSADVDTVEGKKVLTLKAQHGSVMVTATFILTATDANGANEVVSITNLTAYDYDTYAIGGVSE